MDDDDQQVEGTRRWQATMDGRLDQVLAAAGFAVSRSQGSTWIREGRVRVGGAVDSRPSSTVHAGTWIDVDVPGAAPVQAVPQDIPVTVVYEDAHLVVIDKEPGLVVHPGAGHPDGTLVNALLHRYGALSSQGAPLRPGIVHRLDRGTSGLLVVARTTEAHDALAAQFAAHAAGRRYLALCLGSPAGIEGTERSNLGRDPEHRQRFASVSEGKPAVTHWRVRGRGGGQSLLECKLETGRTHQIRVHLAEAGWPLVGDDLYSRAAGRVEAPRSMLHAWRLRLRHPKDGAWWVFEAPLPADFVEALARAGINPPKEVPLAHRVTPG